MKAMALRWLGLTTALAAALALSQAVNIAYIRWLAASVAAPDPGMASPLPTGPDTVFIEEMTWLQVRDALAAGHKTVIVPTGGLEQNGPYLVSGKHNLVCRACAESIARALGDALVAPTVTFVPQGDFDPPTLHMKYPATISVTEETYRNLLIDIGNSFRAHGFAHVIFIADSTGNLPGQKQAAEELDVRWPDQRTRFHDIRAFYDSYDAAKAWLVSEGLREQHEGHHDEFAISAMLLAIDPRAVQAEERERVGKLTINGVQLAPLERTAAWGRKLIQFRTERTVAAIRQAIADRPAR